jgi:hypothetical protein
MKVGYILDFEQPTADLIAIESTISCTLKIGLDAC